MESVHKYSSNVAELT